jgi:transposase
LPRTHPTYSSEFRSEAVRLYRTSDKPLSEIASDLGISRESLRRWVKQQDIDEGIGEGLTTDEREEMSRMRLEIRVLREERELKKAAPESTDQRNSCSNIAAGVA